MQTALSNLLTAADFRESATNFFTALGYQSPRSFDYKPLSFEEFADELGIADSINAERAQGSDWEKVHLLFQFTEDELGAQKSIFEAGKADRELFEAFVFVALELKTVDKKGEPITYSRTQLAGIAREINKPFGSPVIVLFKHGETVTLASVDRRKSKLQTDAHVLQKVSLLKDIRLLNTHRAHLDILTELGGAKAGAHNWTEFFKRWNAVLDISALNKRFYRELSNWYFAARAEAKFPDPAENAAERGLITLITRLIFTWFVKERGLVPEALFEPAEIEKLLKDVQPESDTYYRAVLQNLFFATLNTEMGGRRFRNAAGGPNGQAGDYGLSQFFRYKQEFNSPERWLNLVKDVPFLNGGLFECLDSEDKDGARVDGFSDVRAKQAILPNKLFWGDEFTADLSGAYDDKKQKSVKITPLLNLLRSYKFTIDENTPLEQDVALDPELLGKVFENLLASYNPETRTTARKQTGSFYTPREIVSYMVEESLRAYLEPSLGETASDENREALRKLLTDTSALKATELGLSASQIDALIAAIERCTILDPACGSGAFPMGALSKMVLLLKKLDPQNRLWLNQQLKAVDKALEATGAEASVIEDAKNRVREAFQNNDPDYSRKLYLIERCLFGVDIQPVALQIAKLRFFIALIVDQRIDNEEENRNIRALPNLETKFVAANTLLSLPQTDTLPVDGFEELRQELKEVRRKHVSPKTRKIKKDLEKDDKRIRDEIKKKMTEANFGNLFDTPFVDWNPYDQNQVASFFSPDWMFGPELSKGFDIVIGNPPYGADFSESEKQYIRSNFKSYKYKFESYIYFIEKAISLTKDAGIISYITPELWLRLENAQPIRQIIAAKAALTNLLLCGENVFSQAVVNTSVIILKIGPEAIKANQNIVIKRFGGDEWLLPRKNWMEQPNLSIEYRLHPAEIEVANKIKISGIPLSKFGDAIQGITAYDKYTGQDPELIRNRGYHHQTKVDDSCGKWLSGSDISRYHLKWSGEWLSYGNWLAAPREAKFFEGPRLLFREIPGAGKRIQATYIEEIAYYGHSITPFKAFDGETSILYLLAVANSTLISWYGIRMLPNLGKDIFPKLNPADIRSLPIYPIDFTVALEREKHNRIALLSKQILAAKAADTAADVSGLEREIDELVADLYGLDTDERKLVGIE